MNAIGSVKYSVYIQPASQEDRFPRGDTPAIASTNMRTEAPGNSNSATASDRANKAKEASKAGGCETCKHRQYQDQSNDPGVSMKSATTVAPEAAAAAVASHEGEHVTRERAKAETEGREVVYQTVSYSSAVCPECHKVYISGGLTTTATRSKSKSPQAGVGEALDAYA